MALLRKILSVGEGKRLKELESLAIAVNDAEPATEALTEAELRAKADAFRSRLACVDSLGYI